MDDRERGLYGKYNVTRTDGRPMGRCFVLAEGDPYAPLALKLYAKQCEDTYPLLARDLAEMAEQWDAQLDERFDR